MFLDESEYSCLGCHSKWSDDITDRLMMTLIVLLLVWCVVWELKSVLCSIRFRHNCVLCCDDVYWWNGMLWQCTGTPFFWWGVGVRGWYRICFLILLRSCFLVWSCSFWKICCGVCWLGHSCGAQSHGVRWCAWCLCVLIVFCFVSSSLFFWELWDHAFAFCFVTESLILAQDERWRRA